MSIEIDFFSLKFVFFSTTDGGVLSACLTSMARNREHWRYSLQDSALFVPANTGDFLLVVPMEDIRRAPDHLGAQKLVKILVIFMDEGEKGVRRQSLEQIAQSEARHTDGVFQHVQS